MISSAPLSCILIVYATTSADVHLLYTLPTELAAIAAAVLSAVEISFPDLDAYAASEHEGYKELDDVGRGNLDVLLAATGKTEALLDELKLKVLTVMP
jgi:hypothetical protein